MAHRAPVFYFAHKGSPPELAGGVFFNLRTKVYHLAAAGALSPIALLRAGKEVLLFRQADTAAGPGLFLHLSGSCAVSPASEPFWHYGCSAARGHRTGDFFCDFAAESWNIPPFAPGAPGREMAHLKKYKKVGKRV